MSDLSAYEVRCGGWGDGASGQPLSLSLSLSLSPGNSYRNSYTLTLTHSHTHSHTHTPTHQHTNRKLRRLENIKRNNAVLASLGLGGSGNVLKSLEADKTKAKAAKAAKVAKALKAATRAKRKSWEVPASQRGQPMRVSKRIRAAQSSMAALPNDSDEEGEDGEDGEEEEPAVDYTNTAPFDPSELDDDEFQVYVSVRCKCFGECVVGECGGGVVLCSGVPVVP